MKIILINNLYEPLNRGGAEKITKIIAEEFVKNGDQVSIITTKPWGKIINQQSSIPVFYLNSIYFNLNKIPTFLRLFWHFFNIFNFINYFKIKKILVQEKPDIVIAHNLIGIGFLASLAIRKSGAKYAQYLHDVQLLHPSGIIYFGEEKKLTSTPANIYQKIVVWLFASPDLIFSPSQWLLDLHQRYFEQSKKICLLSPVIIPVSQIKNTEEKKEIFHFFYAGQMETHKGIFFLVKTFLKTTDEKIKLTLIGNGSKFEEIKNLVATDPRIKLIEWPGEEKMRVLVKNANALIVPSFCYENSPTIIYEAVSLGIPVVASRIGGIPELIEKFGGLLFTPNDSKDLIEKMAEIKNNEIIRKKIIARESEQIIDCQLEKYFNQLKNYLSQ